MRNIKKAQYVNGIHKGDENCMIKVTLDDDSDMWVPNECMENMDYAEIKRQVDAGELTIEEAE
jgi:hypothetical protein